MPSQSTGAGLSAVSKSSSKAALVVAEISDMSTIFLNIIGLSAKAGNPAEINRYFLKAHMSSSEQTNAAEDDFEPLIQAGHRICSSDRIEDQEEGFRFMVRTTDIAGMVGSIDHRVDETLPAFVIRFDGQAHAYLNRCAHVAMELDWQPGKFFTNDKTAIICASHDAQYLPDTGECISGPCPHGSRLVKLKIEERAGEIFLCQAN